MTEGPTRRLLADCPAVLFIAYTPGAGAAERGYEPWLVSVDNPFFNAIPGVRHYANWMFERTLHGTSPAYGYFDFQGLDAAVDLEPVWFNPDLDAFRTEWIRLWGYGMAVSSPVLSNAYLMHPVGEARGNPTGFACLLAGQGDPPIDCDQAWAVTETVRKHFATGSDGGPWRVPTAQDNPLGYAWLAVCYGKNLDALAAAYRPGSEELAILARLVAAPV